MLVKIRLPLVSRGISRLAQPRYFSSQDDFFCEAKVQQAAVEHKIVKLDDLRDQEDAEFEYEGRVNDRMTEDDYETQNLMQVGAPSHPH